MHIAKRIDLTVIAPLSTDVVEFMPAPAPTDECTPDRSVDANPRNPVEQDSNRNRTVTTSWGDEAASWRRNGAATVTGQSWTIRCVSLIPAGGVSPGEVVHGETTSGPGAMGGDGGRIVSAGAATGGAAAGRPRGGAGR